MSRKGESITLSISTRDKALLEELALELGMKWGDRPNISKLVEAIARKQIQTAFNSDWSSDRITALDRIFRLLIDAGEMQLANAIAALLLERSELSNPLRRDIEKFLDNPPPPWRQTLDSYIRQQRAFQLTYVDAAETSWSFTIRHAEIVPHEQRQYLDCWCEETKGNFDIPELKHNRCLRLDRISEAAVTPMPGKWRSQLDRVPVTLHLLDGLAFAYKPKTTDLANDWLPDRPVRQVVRSIASTFWFFREILPYGEDCQIVAPDSVRQKFIDKLRSLCQVYNI